MASLPPQDDHRALVKRINSSSYFLNKQLQHICSLNGMRTQGVKAELQKRLIDGTSGYYIHVGIWDFILVVRHWGLKYFVVHFPRKCYAAAWTSLPTSFPIHVLSMPTYPSTCPWSPNACACPFTLPVPFSLLPIQLSTDRADGFLFFPNGDLTQIPAQHSTRHTVTATCRHTANSSRASIVRSRVQRHLAPTQHCHPDTNPMHLFFMHLMARLQQSTPTPTPTT